MEIIPVISGLISLITLIVFFIMSSNISAIRKTLESIKQKDDSMNFARPFNTGRLREYPIGTIVESKTVGAKLKGCKCERA